MAYIKFYTAFFIWTVAAVSAQPSEFYDARLDYSCSPANNHCDQVLGDLKTQVLDSMGALGAIDKSKCTQIKVDGRTKTACNVTSQKEPTRPPPNNALYCGRVKFQLGYVSNDNGMEHVHLEGQFQSELKWYSSSAQTSRALQPLGSLNTTLNTLEPGKEITLPEFADFLPRDFYDEKLRGAEYRVTVTYYYTRDGACAIEAAPAPGGAGGMSAVPVMIALMYFLIQQL